MHHSEISSCSQLCIPLLVYVFFLYVLVLFRYVSYQLVFSVCAVVMGKWKKLKCENQSTETELQK